MNKQKRDGDFSKKTIDALAKRASYKCSICKISTLCAAESSNSAHAHTGQAAHISAASPNGPRANNLLTNKEKSDISNGIYVCQTCGKLIDANRGKDYPLEKLKKIKEEHEKSTREAILPASPEKQKIQSNGNALDDSEQWENLIICFSEECAQKIAKDIMDPRMQMHMKDHNGPGMKKWLKEKFMKVSMNKGDPRAIDFITIKKKALEALDSLINTKDEIVFKEAWALYYKDLISLKNL